MAPRLPFGGGSAVCCRDCLEGRGRRRSWWASAPALCCRQPCPPGLAARLAPLASSSPMQLLSTNERAPSATPRSSSNGAA